MCRRKEENYEKLSHQFHFIGIRRNEENLLKTSLKEYQQPISSIASLRITTKNQPNEKEYMTDGISSNTEDTKQIAVLYNNINQEFLQFLQSEEDHQRLKSVLSMMLTDVKANLKLYKVSLFSS